jgi:hypothetical protein
LTPESISGILAFGQPGSGEALKPEGCTMLSGSSKALWDTMATASRAHNEHNDCTVKALTAATGLSYDECHHALAKQGRKPRKGCHFHTVGKRAAADLGFLMETMRQDHDLGRA